MSDFRIKAIAELSASVPDPSGAISAVCGSPKAMELLKQLAVKSGYRRFHHDNSSESIAAVIEAAQAFFASGDLRDAERRLKSVARVNEPEELAEDLSLDPDFESLHKEIFDQVLARFPSERPNLISGAVSASLKRHLADEITKADKSSPIDAMKMAGIVVCHVPGLAHEGIEATMTSFWDDESSSLTVKPDEKFRRLLMLANISSEEWIEAVERVHGIRIDLADPETSEDWELERAAEWTSFRLMPDDSQGPVVDPEELVLAVDNCPMGFTPLLAFAADAAELCTRDWSTHLGVKGGILGLHDFVNGSGDLLSTVGQLRINPCPQEMMVAEGFRNDFLHVHGLEWGSFRCEIEDIDRAPMRTMTR